jgi:hypothetical protein
LISGRVILSQRKERYLIEDKRTWRKHVKLDNFCYNVVMKTLELLEEQHHYKISDDARKEVAEAVLSQVDSLIES